MARTPKPKVKQKCNQNMNSWSACHLERASAGEVHLDAALEALPRLPGLSLGCRVEGLGSRGLSYMPGFGVDGLRFRASDEEG